MEKSKILILGGYGQVGRYVARELLAHTDRCLVIAGRSRGKAKEAARELDTRAEARKADAFDAASLSAAMRDTGVVVNCAGPSMEIGERVGAVALANFCHYVDVGGFEQTTRVMRSWNADIDRRSLHMCTSSGLFPGLTGVILAYLFQELGAGATVDVGFLFADALSMASAQDIINEIGCSKPLVYRKGRWQKVPLVQLARRIPFASPYGPALSISGTSTDVLNLPVRYHAKSTAVYVALPFFAMKAAVLFAVLVGRLPKIGVFMQQAANGLRVASTIAVRHPDRGFAIHISGKTGNSQAPRWIEVDLVHSSMAFATGVSAAATVQAILDNEVEESGAQYMCEALSPVRTLVRIGKRGLTLKIRSNL